MATAALSFVLCLALFALSPWTPGVTIAHALSWTGCDAARTFGLDLARIGEPGYWARNDGDGDGIACEPNRPDTEHVIIPVT